MVHGENRIPYWIDRRLTGLAGPDYHATILFGLPSEPEDSQYGKCRLNTSIAGYRSVKPRWDSHSGTGNIVLETQPARMTLDYCN